MLRVAEDLERLATALSSLPAFILKTPGLAYRLGSLLRYLFVPFAIAIFDLLV